jgi:hypothetical protein
MFERVKDKTGQSYEILTQAIFQSIFDQTALLNIDVRRNVVLEGKTISHQIDIYWKFEIGEVQYETVVQAKDWDKPVDQGALLQFKSVLDDLPDQPKGIFVTRTGYQSGAKEYALAHGILLYELKEADDLGPALQLTILSWAVYKLVRLPLDGILGTNDPSAANTIALGFDVEVFIPTLSEISFTPSADWLTTEYPEADVSNIGRLHFPDLVPHERLFYDESGSVATTLADIAKEIIDGMKKEGVEQRRATHVFAKSTFVHTDSLQFPRIKADSVSVTIKIERRREIRRAKTSTLAQFVLHELNSGRTRWFAASETAKEKPA